MTHELHIGNCRVDEGCPYRQRENGLVIRAEKVAVLWLLTYSSLRWPKRTFMLGKITGGDMNTKPIHKPIYRPVITNPRSSWRIFRHETAQECSQLHYHSAYEISLVRNTGGRRYVGDCVESFSDLDLVMIGPGLPHGWVSLDSADVISIQLPSAWIENLVETIADMQPVLALLHNAMRGMLFGQAIAMKAEVLFERMMECESFEQFSLLMQLLNVLNSDKSARTLAGAHYGSAMEQESCSDRLGKLMNFIQEHYTDDLRAEQLAKHAHMSTNHFHRFIKQKTDRTFNEWVTDLRLGKACELLITTALPISAVANQCGFNDLSNFNRRFLQVKNCTPSEYRKSALAASGSHYGWSSTRTSVMANA